MIKLQKMRELYVLPEAGQGPAQHLSAASGMVVAGRYYYVVADDEMHLGQFLLASQEAGRWLRLFAGDLPAEKAARKALKPDLEALTLLPASHRFPDGALLAVGSGSKPNRSNAMVIPLGPGGDVLGSPVMLSLHGLYAVLQQRFADLNIEGAFVRGEQLVLMQRANKQHRKSALVYCPLSLLLTLLDNPLADFSPALTIVDYVLPEVLAVPLGFTDAALLPNGEILFTAAAENTGDSYNDGACLGAAIGVIAADGSLRSCCLLSEPLKIEGTAVLVANDVLEVLVVTDADNAAIPASLYRVMNSAELWSE